MPTARNGCLLTLGIVVAVVISAVIGYLPDDFGCSVITFEIGLASESCGPWPIEQWDQAHPIGTNASEFMMFGGGPSLHKGIDILDDYFWPEGNWVVTREAGTIRFPLLTDCNQLCELTLENENHIMQRYVHLDRNSIQQAQDDLNTDFEEGMVLPAGTRLGKVVEWLGCEYHPNQQLVVPFHHLHFEMFGTTQLEPVLSLFPREDMDPPIIDEVWFATNDFEGTPRIFASNPSVTVVHGQVDIVADAYDRQFVTPSQNRKTGVLKLQYKIIEVATAETVKTSNIIDFRTVPLVSNSGDPASNIYVTSMYDNFGRILESKSDYCINDERFLYVLTNADEANPTNFEKRFSWNTSIYPNGAYRVEVTVWDAWNNSATSAKEVEISN